MYLWMTAFWAKGSFQLIVVKPKPIESNHSGQDTDTDWQSYEPVQGHSKEGGKGVGGRVPIMHHTEFFY